jgi:hypothetical protein
MLFLQLSALLSLVSLNSFPFLGWEHLFVFDPQLSALKIQMVHCFDDHLSLLWSCEVCKSQTPKNTTVEVIVECVGKWKTHVGHNLRKLLLLDCEWDILDNNSSGDKFFAIIVRGGAILLRGHGNMILVLAKVVVRWLHALSLSHS